MQDSLSLIFSTGFVNFWTGMSFATTSIRKLDAHPEVITLQDFGNTGLQFHACGLRSVHPRPNR
jgi:hypothetical protein